MCALMPFYLGEYKFNLADEGMGFTYYQYAQLRAIKKQPIDRSPTHALQDLIN